MVGVHVEFRLKPGTAPVFLEWKRREGELQVKAPGFIKRSLHRNADDPNIYYYISWWQTEDQMHGFAQTPGFKRAFEETGVGQIGSERVLTLVHEVFDEAGERPND